MVAQGGRGCVWLLWGACVVTPGGGHAWLLLGGHAWLLGGHEWLPQGACMVGMGGGGHAWLLLGGGGVHGIGRDMEI